MAQTRAIGKAYRNIIGWVMKMAGYEGTPGEEMKAVIITKKEIKKEEKRTDKISELKLMLKGGTDEQKTRDLKRRTGIILKNFKISEKQASIILATLLNSETK